MKAKFFSFLILTILLLISIDFSCFGQGKPKVQPSLRIEPFKEMPKEMNGCGYEFHLNKKDRQNSRFIFLNDFGKFGMALVNGTFERLELKEHKDFKTYYYSNKNLEVKITFIKSEHSGNE